MINILPLLFIDDIYAGQCDDTSVFLGSPRNRAVKGIDEVLNGERTEIMLWQETERVSTYHTEGAEQRLTEKPT